MHIKRDISISNLKMILNVLNRKPGFSGRSKRLLSAKLPTVITSLDSTLSNAWRNRCEEIDWVQQFKSRLRLEPKVGACAVQIS